MCSITKHLSIVLIIFIISFGISNLGAETKGANPEINKPYENPNYSVWVRRFESSGREVYDQREKITDLLQIKPGDKIADVGAGTGLFTRIFSERVGSKGQVYAIDISRNFVNNIRKWAEAKQRKNIETIVNSQTNTGLKNNSVDLVFICDTYHHFENPEKMMQSVYQALKPGGRLFIIDFRKQKNISSDWVMKHVRADQSQVIKEVRAAGFQYLREIKLLKQNYFLMFRKLPVR